jgi:predicted DNA-binding transcriptional regulator YafY
MRQEKAARLLELARELAASRYGLTLDEMGEKIGTQRRTTERMRDRLLEMFDNMEELSDPPTKRWRIVGKLDGFFNVPSADEFAALMTAREALAQSHAAAAESLRTLEGKLRASVDASLHRRLEPDIEALMQAEAIAVQPGPRAYADPERLKILRDAMLRLRQVRFSYRGGSTPGARRTLNPYGMLSGGEVYVIGVEPGKGDPSDPRTWRLDRMDDLEVLSDPGGPPDDWSLQAFTARSFGIYQEPEMSHVRLHVFPEYADEVRGWRFHGSQQLVELADGAVEVRLEGCGLRELAWALVRWGGKLKVLEPPRLKTELRAALAAAADMVE